MGSKLVMAAMSGFMAPDIAASPHRRPGSVPGRAVKPGRVITR